MQSSEPANQDYVPEPDAGESVQPQIIQVIVAARLDKVLCYLNKTGNILNPGELIRVPLGNKKATAIVVGKGENSGNYKLKNIFGPLEPPLRLPEELIELFNWTARYYHAPIGQVLSTALPKSLLDGKPARPNENRLWQAASFKNPQPGSETTNRSEPKATPKQQQLLDWLKTSGPATTGAILDAGFGRHLLKAVRDKGLVESKGTRADELPLLAEKPLAPNPEQTRALQSIQLNTGPFLLAGVTGSGKTEVYLQAAQRALENHQQVLFLVPEIGLIPQTLARVNARFNLPVLGYHSAASESEKSACWRQSASGAPLIIVGTRSAVFLPFTRLGLTIIDEEQDLSYKQFDGIRYNARDLALVRTQKNKGKLILGSATPSLESIYNVERGNYELLRLKQRVAKKILPRWQLIQSDPSSTLPVASETLKQIDLELSQGGQILVFLNRRGFAPRFTCQNCAWTAICRACDSQMCIHQQPRALVCHRCDGRLSVPASCPACGSIKLETRGFGTEQLETFLGRSFPRIPCIRIDRDSTQRKNSFSEKISQLHAGDPALLVGTQMITKGHHLPGISLVVALGADSALFSHDFRAIEHLTQTLTQVAGRSGRGQRPGTILIETSQPDHPLLKQLSQQTYDQISQSQLDMRKQHGLPPAGFCAVLHASSAELKLLNQFMESLQASAGSDKVQHIGPMPSITERKAGRYRYQIRFFANTRSDLHAVLAILESRIAQMKGFSKIRWAIDIDPLTMD